MKKVVPSKDLIIAGPNGAGLLVVRLAARNCVLKHLTFGRRVKITFLFLEVWGILDTIHYKKKEQKKVNNFFPLMDKALYIRH